MKGSRAAPPPFKGNGVRAIDKGIARQVRILWENGIETTESCEGGKGHSFPEATVRFRGGHGEGKRRFRVPIRRSHPEPKSEVSKRMMQYGRIENWSILNIQG